MTRTLSLIDGHYQIYRSFFAFSGRPLTNSEGRRVDAIYAITQLLWSLYRARVEDGGWAIALDAPGPTFRHERFPDYKAHREEMPEELREQLPHIDEIIAGFRIPLLLQPGFEADDLIATAATRACAAGWRVEILSKDKDLEQILSPGIQLRRDPSAAALYGVAELLEKRGIRPDQVVDYQALIGDSADNIPGVRGIGPKTALKILAALEGTAREQRLERLLEDPPPACVPPAALHKVRAAPEDMFLSRELARLRLDASLPEACDFVQGGDLAYREPDFARLQPTLQRLGFRSFLREMERELGPVLSVAEDGEAEPERDYRLIESEEELASFVARCREVGRFAVDSETSGLDPFCDHIVGISIAAAPGSAAYIPLTAPRGERCLSRSALRGLLAPLLADETIEKIGHNLKFDMQFLESEGLPLAGVAMDTMIASYLLQPTGASQKLDDLVAQRLGHRMIPIRDIIGEGDDERSMAELPPSLICEYACEDADYTLRLADLLAPELHGQGLERVHDLLETPLLPVLVTMERTGIRLDPGRLEELEAELSDAVTDLTDRIYQAAGTEFTINSPKQTQAVLFEHLGLPPGAKTKTGYSTSASVLEVLAADHPEQPVPRLLLEYRSLTKLLNTYVTALPKLLHPRTGRLHTDFRQTVAATGRLASNRPNLQNIPVKTELGRRVRRAFLPGQPGHAFLSADYSQIELRILAHLSGDPELCRALRGGADIHRAVAARIHQKSPEDVTREERTAAKAVNFGVIYGMGAFGLARDLGIPRAEAQAFIDAFFAGFPGVRAFIDRTIDEATERGEVRTMYGRRRALPELASRLPRDRQQGQRFAVNTVIQGSAADLIKKAMIDVHRDLAARNSPALMLLQIHDELLFELSPDLCESEGRVIRKCMEGVFELDVPLVVNVSSGEDWYDASK